MKRIVALLALTVAALAASSCAKHADARPAAQKKIDVAAQRIERGRYLVTIIGCNDCHTPFKMGPNGPEPDMSRALSGHPETFRVAKAPKLDGTWMSAGAATNTAFAGPWGISYAANLTPEKLTGLGIWDEALFVKTIRSGRHWGTSRPILPPMPWQAFAKMTDEDLESIYAYLRTVKPVRNQVPDAILAPPPSAAKSAA